MLLVLPLASLVALAVEASAQTAVLLTDLNKRSNSRTVNPGSEFRPLAVAPTSPTLYFSARTETQLTELWMTQGTAATTSIVSDYRPGRVSGNPGRVTVLPDGSLTLRLDHPTRGPELHRVLPANGHRIELAGEVNPGPEGATFSRSAPLGARIYHLAQIPRPRDTYDVVLAGVDGKQFQIAARIGRAPAQQPELVKCGNLLYLSVDDGVHGCELHVSNGTQAGTRLVADSIPGAGGGCPRRITPYRGQCYMSIDLPGIGRELARSDGTKVELVKDIFAGAGSSNPGEIVEFNGRLYYRANDGSTGRELFRTDANGQTGQVVDLNTGAPGSDPREITRYSTYLAWIADDSTSGAEVRVMDANERVRTVDIRVGTASSAPAELSAAGNKLVFSADDGASGRQLWVVDDKLQPKRITNPLVGGQNPRRFVNISTTLIAFAFETTGRPDEVWVADLTKDTAAPLADLNPSTTGTQASGARGFFYFGGTTFFYGSDGISGQELYETDGTELGTKRLTDHNPGAAGAQIGNLAPLGNRLFMTATRFTTGNEPHVYDPVAKKLEVIRDLAKGARGSFPTDVAGPFVVRGSSAPLMMFAANDGVSGRELWRTDGTTEGTFMLRDINPLANGSFPKHMVQLDDQVLFLATTSAHGTELWRTDGTRSGTQLVKDILPDTASGARGAIAVLRAVGYFPANDGRNGIELWRTDGTAAGTFLVIDIHPRSSSAPSGLTTFNNNIWFRARTDEEGFELYSSDGTRSGTVRHDLVPGPGSSNPERITAAGANLFFAARTSATGERRLWVTQGGRPSVISGVREPGKPTAVGNKIYFSVTDQSNRSEPWVSDGTSAGTKVVLRLTDKGRHTAVNHIGVAGGNVYITANDGIIDQEAYVVATPGASSQPLDPPCGGSWKLSTTSPRLGENLRLSGDATPANQQAIVLLGLELARSAIPIAGCFVRIDLTSSIVVDSFATGAGGPWQRDVPVPDDSALIGKSLAAWVGFVPRSPPLILRATNGVLLTFGR